MTTTATSIDRAAIDRTLMTDGIAALTGAFSADWADRMRGHLLGRVVDELEPIVQKHTIEGLVMGEP